MPLERGFSFIVGTGPVLFYYLVLDLVFFIAGLCPAPRYPAA